MSDIKQFTLDLDKFSRSLGIAVEKVQKKIAFDLFRRIVQKTPVDTGRARASWTIAINAADRTVAPAGQVSYPAPKAPNLDVTPGRDIWISNNLPYIVTLEHGRSKQAPNGMVALSVEEVSIRMNVVVPAGLREAGL